MNAEALAEVERLRQDAQGCFSGISVEEALRQAMRWAYADAARVCRETWKNAPNVSRINFRMNEGVISTGIPHFRPRFLQSPYASCARALIGSSRRSFTRCRALLMADSLGFFARQFR